MKTEIFENKAAFDARPDKTVNGVSPEFAKEHPKYAKDNETNAGCWNCRGCIWCGNCTDCTGCTGGAGCTECRSCTGCGECRRCSGCTDCDLCSGCTGCTDCTGLKSCANYTGGIGGQPHRHRE